MAEGYNIKVVMGDGTMIHTTVTSSSLDVQCFTEEVQGSPIRIAGLDAEWRPNRKRRTGQNPIAIIHDTGIPHLAVQLPLPLRLHLVGVGIAADAKRLHDDYNLEVSKVLDLREWAANSPHRPRPELRSAGLKDMALEVMGARIAQPRQVTIRARHTNELFSSARSFDWGTPSLSREQVEYASIDAYISFEIGHLLLTGN
ncbi:hypothetical protein VPH35_113577 [Triticum aestivum]